VVKVGQVLTVGVNTGDKWLPSAINFCVKATG
jgi:hypothetical protein